MRLILSRATVDDFDQLIQLAYKSFEGDAMTTIFMGYPDSAPSYAHVKRQWLNDLQKTNYVWFKLEDAESSAEVDIRDDAGQKQGTETRTKIVGGCHWHIDPSYVPPKEDEPTGPPLEHFNHLKTEQEREDAHRYITNFVTQGRQNRTEPHVYCGMLFVHPECHRLGLGRILMQCGIDVADTLMLPCWLESSPKGEGLYRKLGFEEHSRETFDLPSFPGATALRMRRPAKDLRREVPLP